MNAFPALASLEQLAAANVAELSSYGYPLRTVKLTPYYRALVEREIASIGAGGPLYHVVFPKVGAFERLQPIPLTQSLNERVNAPKGLEGIVLHKYRHKLLICLTQRCLAHCHYCFRPVIPGRETKEWDSEEEIHGERLLVAKRLPLIKAYIEAHPEIRELIFSGGDPLVLPVPVLEEAFGVLRSVPHVQHLRIHSKAPVFEPAIVTDRLADFLGRYRVKLVLHIVHPYELTPELVQRVDTLVDRRVQVFNQFPLLRGINDHAEVIRELAQRCSEAYISMLAMHIPDVVPLSDYYRPRLDRVYAIADELFRTSEAWAWNVRVLLDTPYGKMRRDDIVARDFEQSTYTFARGEHRFVYRDIAAALDEATPVARLLYR